MDRIKGNLTLVRNNMFGLEGHLHGSVVSPSYPGGHPLFSRYESDTDSRTMKEWREKGNNLDDGRYGYIRCIISPLRVKPRKNAISGILSVFKSARTPLMAR